MRRSILLLPVLALLIPAAAWAYDLDKKAPGPKLDGERVGASDCKTKNWERLVWKRDTQPVVTASSRKGAVSTDTRVLPSHTEPCPKPEPEPVVEPAAAPVEDVPAAPAAPVSSSLEAIAQCESGGSYSAVNSSSGAYGKYQIMPSTSAAYGCDMSSPAGQDACAQEIYAAEGSSAWVC